MAKLTPAGYCSHRVRPTPSKPRPTKDVIQASPAFPTGYWGQPIPVGFGRRKVPGQVVWASKIRVIGGNRFCDMALAFGYSLVPATEIEEVKLVTLYFNGKKVYSLLSSDTISTYGDGALTTIGSSSCSNSKKPKMEVRWYAGKANQNVNRTIRNAVGEDQAVAYRNMLYCVITNINMDKFKLTEAPIVEALLADNYTANTIYERVGNISVDVNYATWDSGANLLYHFGNTGTSMEVYDYNTLKRQSTRSLVGSYAVAGTLIENVLVADKETGLIAVAYGDNSTEENRATHIINPRTRRIGSGFYAGVDSDVELTSTTSGCPGKYEFIHAAGNPNDGLFLAVAPEPGLSNSDADWLGILRVNPNTGGLTYVWSHNFNSERVNGIFYSPEERFEDWGVLYVLVFNKIYRLRINKNATASNASGLVQLTELDTFSINSSANGQGGIYDASSNRLLIYYTADDPAIYSYDLDTPANSFDTILPDMLAGHERFFRGSDISNGSLWVQIDGNSVVNLNLPDMHLGIADLTDVVHVGDTSATTQTAVIGTGSYWDSRKQAFLVPSITSVSPSSTGFGIVWPNFGYLSDGTGVSLANVFRWMMAYAGYETWQIDVTQVPDTSEHKVLGGFWINATDVWDEINLIADAYNIDVFESGGAVKFVKKDRSSGITTDQDITSDMFIPIESSLVTRISRQKSQDLPHKVTVYYYDSEVGYTLTSQFANRATFPGRTAHGSDPVDYHLPLVLYPSRARTLAARILYALWEEQNAVEITLPRKYLRVEPGDILGLSISFPDGGEHEAIWKVRDSELTLDFQNRITAVEIESEEDYIFPNEASGGIYDEPVIAGLVECDPLVLDVPRPEKNSATVVEVLGASVPVVRAGWEGGNLYYEKNDDLTFQGFTSGQYQPLRMQLQLELSNDNPWYFNALASTKVSIITGNTDDLRSVSDSQILAGANLALVGNSVDGYEYIQFRDVVDNGDGTYTLTGFVRGLRGTEYLTRSWSVGDDFILVNRSAFLTVDVTADLGSTASFVSAGIGEALDEGSTASINVTGHALKPYAPVYPYITSGAWGGTLVVGFCPRNRGSYDLPDDEDIALFPYDESPVEFEVEIIDTDATTVLRTYTGLSTPEFTYSAAHQAADFATKPDPLYIRIYQISSNATIDRGYSNLLELIV